MPGRKEPRQMVPPGDVICTVWPVSVTGYPAAGLPNSWREIWDMVQELGHDITLAGRYTTKRSMHGANKRPGRSPKLTLRGPKVREVFRLVIQKTKAAGISLWKLPLATPRGEDEPDEPKAGESEEEAPLAPLQEEENNVDWGSPPASESDVEEERNSEAAVPPQQRVPPASRISAAASSAESSRRASVTVSHAASAEPYIPESLVRNARAAIEDRSVKSETKEQLEHVIRSEAKVGFQSEGKVVFLHHVLETRSPRG